MLEVSLVYAAADAALAHSLGQYIETNCRVRIDGSLVVTPNLPLLEAAGRALGSDAAIIFVSPHSVPGPLERDDWEPLLVDYVRDNNAQLAYIDVAPAPFPKVLLRTRSFAPSDLRGVKRWILGIRPPLARPSVVPPGEAFASAAEIEALRVAVADRPENTTVTAPVARAFIDQVHAEFHGIVWVDAVGASTACASGELGAQLGLRLPGELQANLESIRTLLNEYRCLIVLEGAAGEVAEEFLDTGLSSVLVVNSAQPDEPTVDAARAMLSAIAGWVGNPAGVPPSGRVRHTLEWLLADPERWDLACETGRAMAGFLRFQDRLAEAFEVLELVLSHAIRIRDARIANEFGRDRGWILESWGRKVRAVHPFAPAEEEAVQLALW